MVNTHGRMGCASGGPLMTWLYTVMLGPVSVLESVSMMNAVIDTPAGAQVMVMVEPGRNRPTLLTGQVYTPTTGMRLATEYTTA